jgi:hypothetical protein
LTIDSRAGSWHKDLQLHAILQGDASRPNFPFTVPTNFLTMGDSNLDLTGFQHTMNKSIDDLDTILRDINKKVFLLPSSSRQC